jgi:hypothetical protein
LRNQDGRALTESPKAPSRFTLRNVLQIPRRNPLYSTSSAVISFFEQYRADRRIWRAFYRHSRTFSLAARLLPRRV